MIPDVLASALKALGPLLKVAPVWIIRLVAFSSLIGISLNATLGVFRPSMPSGIDHYIDFTQVNAQSLTGLSFVILGIITTTFRIFRKNRALESTIQSQIEMLENAMRLLGASEIEKRAVRRSVLSALTTKTLENIGGELNVNIFAAAKQQMPELGSVKTSQETE